MRSRWQAGEGNRRWALQSPEEAGERGTGPATRSAPESDTRLGSRLTPATEGPHSPAACGVGRPHGGAHRVRGGEDPGGRQSDICAGPPLHPIRKSWPEAATGREDAGYVGGLEAPSTEGGVEARSRAERMAVGEGVTGMGKPRGGQIDFTDKVVLGHGTGPGVAGRPSAPRPGIAGK